MTQLETNSTLTGRNHPETSSIAARTALGKSGSKRRRVLGALILADATDEELQDRLRMGANTQRPRRVELVRYGMVEDSGERRPSAGGNPSIVWKASEMGRWLMDMLEEQASE